MCLPSRQIVFYIDAILPSAYCSLRRSRLCCPLAPNECTLLDPAPARDLLFSSAADKCVPAWQDNLKRFTGAKRSGQPAQFCTLMSIGFHDVSTISETEKLANGASIIMLIFGGSVLIVGVFTIILGVSTPFSIPA